MSSSVQYSPSSTPTAQPLMLARKLEELSSSENAVVIISIKQSVAHGAADKANKDLTGKFQAAVKNGKFVAALQQAAVMNGVAALASVSVDPASFISNGYVVTDLTSSPSAIPTLAPTEPIVASSSSSKSGSTQFEKKWLPLVAVLVGLILIAVFVGTLYYHRRQRDRKIKPILHFPDRARESFEGNDSLNLAAVFPQPNSAHARDGGDGAATGAGASEVKCLYIN